MLTIIGMCSILMYIVTEKLLMGREESNQTIQTNNTKTSVLADPLIAVSNAPISTKVVCFSRLLKCLRSLYGKQCGPRSDCSYRSSLFWFHAVRFYTLFVSKARQLFAADDFSRRHFQMHFFLAHLVQ